MVSFSKSSSLLIILILAVSSLIVVAVPNVKADLYINGSYLAFKPYIIFPLNSTYDSRLLSLKVNFHALIYGGLNYSMTYSLDGQEKVEVPLVVHYFGMFNNQESYIDGSVLLPAMPNGSHKISVILNGKEEVSANGPSPQDIQIIGSSDIETVYFSTYGFTPTPTPTASPTPTPSPTPSPTLTPAPTPTPTITGSFTTNNATLLSAVTIVAVIAIGAGLLVYFKKLGRKVNK